MVHNVSFSIENQAKIHAEQMSLIDKESVVSIIGGLCTAIFYTYVLNDKVPSNILYIWLSIISVVYVLRWIITRYIYPLKNAPESNSYNWEKVYVLGTAIAGACWGVGSYYIFPEDNVLLEAVIVLTIGGLVAAASVAYSPSRYIGFAFAFPAIIPLSVYFFSKPGNEFFYMGMLISIYLVVMAASNRMMHISSSKSIKLKFKNQGLIETLKNKIIKIEDMSGEMSYQASHDMLTGLVNRREFESILEKAAHHVTISKRTYVVCYIDLDDFKIINDTCGHVAGDAFIQSVAKLIDETTRGTDRVARIGSDEFGLLLPMCNIGKACEIADEIRKKIKAFEFLWENKRLDLSASIGLVEINENTTNMCDVLKSADAACYVAKELGKNRISVFKEDDVTHTRHIDDLQGVQAVKKSLSEDRFVLYAQEIRSTSNDEIKWHGELLVRMLGEDDEIIPPGKFIPAAERYNLMTEIDKWVINESFDYVKKLEEKYKGSVLCAINLSGQSVCDKDFFEYILAKFIEKKISPLSICFEITETAAISNFLHAEKLLRELKLMGCRFSLDDFGSGLSSFGYLKRLDVDYLKIDGSFVKTMMDDVKDYALVKSINQIGKEMGMKTIAEFVENEELHNALIELNVDYVQGYGIAKPVPLSSLI